MCAILQLVSAPLNPIPIAEHFRRSHPQCEHSYGQHIYMSKENKIEVEVEVEVHLILSYTRSSSSRSITSYLPNYDDNTVS